MQTQTHEPSRWVEFPLDVKSIVRDYAQQYVSNSCDHESLNEFAERVALDLKMPEAKKWAKKAVAEMEKI